MSTLHRITLKSTLLVLLAASAQPACSGSAPAGETLPAPVAAVPTATTAAVRPSAGVSATAPATLTVPSSAQQALVRLQDVLATDFKTAAPVLVIPAQEMTAERHDRIVEDLSIMSRIIEKNLRDTPEERFGFTILGNLAYGQDMFLRADSAGPPILQSVSGRPKPMYLGGYGAVFSLRVAFPLVPPPETPEPNKAEEPTDGTWAQARQELLDPQAARRTQKGAPQSRAYSAEAVESLRTTLIGLLKHATNIRDLEPESWLTILVQGPSPTAEDPAPYPRSGQPAGLTGVPAARRTLLTLRAKKADIDQLAEGRLDDAQFQQRVQTTTF